MKVQVTQSKTLNLENQPDQLDLKCMASPHRGSRHFGHFGNIRIQKLHTLRDISKRMIETQRDSKRKDTLRKSKTFIALMNENFPLNPKLVTNKLISARDANANKINRHLEKAVVNRNSKGEIMSLAFVIKPKNRRPSPKDENNSLTDLGSVEDILQTDHKDTLAEENQDVCKLNNLIRPIQIQDQEEEIYTHKRISQMKNITDFRLLALNNLKSHENEKSLAPAKSDRHSRQDVHQIKGAEIITRKRSIYYIKNDNSSNPDAHNSPLSDFLKYQSKLKSYDQKIQQDKRFQNLILKDNLLILIDKSASLKNIFAHTNKMTQVFEMVDSPQQCKYNVKLEKVLCNMHYICCILMLDYKEVTKAVKLTKNPLLALEAPQNFPTERQAFQQLLNLYNSMHDFLKDRIECYFIIIKQANCLILQNDIVEILFSYLNKTRYIISELQELYRILDKKQLETRKTIVTYKNAESYYRKSLDNMQIKNPKGGSLYQPSRSAILTLPYFKNMSLSDKVVKDSHAQQNQKKSQDHVNIKMQQKKLMENLILNKFKNKNQNKQTTRESKIVLVNNKVDNSNLVQSFRKTKEVYAIADNRKRIQMERLQKPHETPIIKEAMKIIKKSFNQFKSVQPI